MLTNTCLLKALGHKPHIALTSINNSLIKPEDDKFVNDICCLTPNFLDKEIAESSISDLENTFQVDKQTCSHIKEMHLRLASIGSGSWPSGNRCHPDKYPHVGYHATKIYVDHDDLMSNTSLDREVTDEEWQNVVVDAKVWPSLTNPVNSVAECKRLFVYDESETGAKRAKRVNKQTGSTLNVLDMGLWLAFESTRRIGVYLIEMFDGPNGDHNIHFRTYAMPGSLSGLGYFPNGRCDDHVTCNIDSLNRYSLGWLTGLSTHELGHCIKFYHEFRNPQSNHRSIMSYAQDNSPFQGYRRSGAPYQYVEDHSWPEARVLFGGDAAEPIDIITEPSKRLVLDPLIVDKINGLPVIRNQFEYDNRWFIIVPKPSL